MDLYRSGKMLKHVGVFSGRKVVVMMPDPSDLNYVFVVEAERLPNSLEEAVVREVETGNAQSKVWFSEHLHGLEYDGLNMIRFLFKTAGAVTRAPYNSVLMVPVPGHQIPLAQVYDNMLQATKDLAAQYVQWKAKSGDVVETVATESRPQDFTASSHNDVVDNAEQNRAIARNLLFQAQTLQADATQKFEEAYKYDPSLRPLESDQIDSSEWTDGETGKSYKTEAALKAAISRRENAKVK